jgi:spore germination cell wall hydrolase CwlJ-like protein
MVRYMLVFTFGILAGTAIQQCTKPVAKLNNETQYKEAAEWIARAAYSESKMYSNYEYIAWTIRNRMVSPEYPASAKSVVLQEKQFSAFNNSAKASKLKSMSYPETKNTYFRRAYRIALYVLNSGKSVNPMPEVTHFYMKDTLQRTQGKSAPYWARGKEPYFQNGQTKYYQNVKAP